MRIIKILTAIAFISVISLFYGCCCGGVGEQFRDIAGGNTKTFEFEGLTFNTPPGFAQIESPPYLESSGAPEFTSFYSNEDGDILIRCRLDEFSPPGSSDSGVSVDMTTQANLEVYALTYAANASGRMNTGATVNKIQNMVLDNAGATAGCMVSIPLSDTQKEIQGYDLEYLVLISKAPDRIYLVSMAYKISAVTSAVLAISTVQAGIIITE